MTHEAGTPAQEQHGLVVKHLKDGIQWDIGSPGAQLARPICWSGDLPKDAATLAKLQSRIFVDLPGLLPLADGFSMVLSTSFGEYQMLHRVKRAGEEDFSSLPSHRLPHFSSLVIAGAARPVLPDVISIQRIEDAPASEAHLLVEEVVGRLNHLLGSIDRPILSHLDPSDLSYGMVYLSAESPHIETCRVYFPFTGVVKLQGPENTPVLAPQQAAALLQFKIDIASRTREPRESAGSFVDAVTRLVHDFSFYARQAPEALGTLSEEHIRDVFLLAVKLTFAGQGNGEVFSYDGKLDFKIVNPKNAYEYVTGEFKWWAGPSSATEALHQALRKHSAAGQEAAIFLIMLSKNQSSGAVFEKMRATVLEQSEVDRATLHEDIVPNGSKELMGSVTCRLRAAQTTLVFGIADLFHQKA